MKNILRKWRIAYLVVLLPILTAVWYFLDPRSELRVDTFFPIQKGEVRSVRPDVGIWVTKDSYKTGLEHILRVDRKEIPEELRFEIDKIQTKQEMIFKTHYLAKIKVLDSDKILGFPVLQVEVLEGRCKGRIGWMPGYRSNFTSTEPN